jgi:molybdopterin converting factor small subunit
MATTVMIRIPTPLRKYCDDQREFPVSADDVRGALEDLARKYPALYPNICDETGAVRRHLGVFVNDSLVRDLDGLDTKLAPQDVVTVLAAVSGG